MVVGNGYNSGTPGARQVAEAGSLGRMQQDYVSPLPVVFSTRQTTRRVEKTGGSGQGKSEK